MQYAPTAARATLTRQYSFPAPSVRPSTSNGPVMYADDDMLPRPAHLTPDNAARFKDQSVVDFYPLRLPYPPQVFDILVDLITDEPRAVLDVGSGTGDIARGLVRRVERVDAVDFSEAMIAKGKMVPEGDHPHLRWIYGAVDTVALDPPYALVTAGESVHWMNWEVVFPRF